MLFCVTSYRCDRRIVGPDDVRASMTVRYLNARASLEPPRHNDHPLPVTLEDQCGDVRRQTRNNYEHFAPLNHLDRPTKRCIAHG